MSAAPACGSGAFLIQALEFLVNEHREIDELRGQLLGGSIIFSDISTNILEKNIYGVDLNEESVEIAKLSLWLRTAQKGRKLNTLSNNIKCGNSLIDDPEVAGEKAFNWQKEFPTIFQKKKKKTWHITTATHNSRYSQRMFDNYVITGEPVWLSEKEEIIVTKTIAQIVQEDKLNIPAFNICGDHMHTILVCEKEELPKNGACSVAWRTGGGRHNGACFDEYAGNRSRLYGGFDIVIGNPSYVHLEKTKKTSVALKNAGYKTYHSQGDKYCVFVKKGFDLLKTNGLISFIMPNNWLLASYPSVYEWFIALMFVLPKSKILKNIFLVALIIVPIFFVYISQTR